MANGLPGLPPPGFLSGQSKGLPGLPAPGFLDSNGGWTGDDLVASEPATAGQMLAGGIANMFPVNFGDEAMAGISALRDKAIHGEDLSGAYDRNLAQIRDYESQFRDQHPVASIFSALAGNAPAAVAAPSLIPEKAGLGTALAAASAEGGLWGIGYGFGSGEGGAENRLREAAKQGLAGEVIAPAVTGGLKFAGWAASLPTKVADYVRGVFQSPEKVAGQDLLPAAQDILSLPASADNPFYETQTLANATQNPYLAQLEQRVGKSSDRMNELLNANRATREKMQLGALAGISEQPTGAVEQAGMALRGVLEPEATSAREAAESIFASLDKGGSVPMGKISRNFGDSMNTIYEAGGEPSSLRGIASEIADATRPPEVPSPKGLALVGQTGEPLASESLSISGSDPTKPFSYVHSLRQRAQDAWTSAKINGDKRAAGVANGLVRTIDDVIKEAGESGGISSETAANFEKAKLAFSDYAMRYADGPVGLTLQKMGEGRYNHNASSVPNFFFNGKPESTRALLKALPDTPEALDVARGALRDKILNDRPLVTNDGVISPGNFRTWLRTNKDALTASTAEGRTLLEPEHLTTLDRLSEDLAFLDPSSNTSSRQLAYQASKGQPTTAQALLMQDAFGRVPGFVPGSKVANAVIDRLATSRENKINDILARALIDKEYAKILVQPATEARVGVVRAFLDAVPNALNEASRLAPNAAGQLSPLVAPQIGELAPQAARISGASGGTNPPADRTSDRGLSNRSDGRPAAPNLLSLSRQEDRESSLDPNSIFSVNPSKSIFSVPAPILDAVKTVESHGDANAVGAKTKYGTAKGAYQLLDATGREYHNKLGIKEAYDPFNEPQARQIAAAYLADLIAEFGDLRTALTAYHTGPGNVKKGNIGPVGRRYADSIFKVMEV